MIRIDRFNKLGFTGLMKNDRKGEWVRWEEVKILLDDNECEITKDLYNKYLRYKDRCSIIVYASLILNVLLMWALFI